MTVLLPMEELEEVPCLVCHHGYTAHEAGGGHCRAVLSNGPMHRLPCMCPGMRWVAAVVAEPPTYG